jgi:hypothetical protein
VDIWRRLTAISLKEIYEELKTTAKGSQVQVRAAFYSMFAGAPVSERDRPSDYYAIRLTLGGKGKYLSLPGVSSQALHNVFMSEERRKKVIEAFKKKYGEGTINYWVSSAQYRSVAIAATAMKKARKRDGNSCVICKFLGTDTERPARAHHLISRKSVFWAALLEVEKTKGDIFKDNAVFDLKRRIQECKDHNDSRFIAMLCSGHDKCVQDVLGESIRKANIGKLLPLIDL